MKIADEFDIGHCQGQSYGVTLKFFSIHHNTKYQIPDLRFGHVRNLWFKYVCYSYNNIQDL